MSCARPLPFKCSAVISDVDGTLVTDDKVLTARARAAVAELRASGIIFSIISSRPPRGLRMLVEPLGITTPVGGFNGGVIATPDLSVITEHLLSPQVARRAVDILNARGAQVWVFSGQDWLVRDPDGPYIGLRSARWGSNRQSLRILDPPSMPPPRSSASATISIFSRSARATSVPRSATGLPSPVRNPTTSTSPTRLPTRARHCRRSRSCWRFRWRKSPSLATAATTSRCSSEGLSIAMGNASAQVQREADFVRIATAKMDLPRR